MEILPPKYVGDRVLPDAKYPEFWRLIDIQGLRPFLYTHGRYYPRFVAAAFTTIFIREDEDEGEEFALGFRLGGRKYKFTLAALATAWGLKDEGDTFKCGNYPLGMWNEFSKATAVRELRLEYAAPGKYTVNRMSIDHRLLLYVLSYVLLPRKSNHGTATEEDLLILWAIVNEKQIHWPYLMAHRMLRYSQGKPATPTVAESPRRRRGRRRRRRRAPWKPWLYLSAATKEDRAATRRRKKHLWRRSRPPPPWQVSGLPRPLPSLSFCATIPLSIAWFLSALSAAILPPPALLPFCLRQLCRLATGVLAAAVKRPLQPPQVRV
ncbi:hypothetical protein PIB30_081386 [Stylosanthes scabra]|uniref:Uncharacterized protein n=1 Tax=Stylosanthes scabra TaxID=79078 RepID=A0ABU6UQH1_9FABA|nr:hypothetical protein [Stylosanthes scabra]